MGVLIHELVTVLASALNMKGLHQEATFLRQHVIIASFVNTFLQTSGYNSWIKKLENLIRAKTSLHSDVGDEFVYVKFHTIVKQVLALSPCCLLAGTVIFQKWFPGFNPTQPEGVITPRWIYLKIFLLEFHQHEAKTIVSVVETVMEADNRVTEASDPRFCIVIDPA